MRIPLLVLAGSLMVLGASTADAARSAAKSDDRQAVIIELTTPPSARAATSGASASVQRARVRRVILDLERRGHAARGRRTPLAADVIRFEYRVVANGFAATLLPETIQALSSNPDVRRIVPDAMMHAILDVSVPLVRAPEVWSDFGYRGAGVTIAVIDTGTDYTHPDLGGCFGPGCKVIGGYDFINNDADPQDDNGHGTHVAATAAGDGVLRGVAPDAHVLAYKVLAANGSGPTSIIIAGIERATDPDDNGDPSDHASIISMSLGGGGDENDPASLAVDAATAAGVLCVIAAGNNHENFLIGSPGTARTALTVGATDDNDQIASFSSRGPTIPTRLLKPEITAPGVGICAARRPGSYADKQCLDTQHASLSGTSMATPHVAGAAALLRGLNPGLSPAEAKAILQEAAVPLGLDATTGGAGRLDIRAAVDVTTALVPAPLNLGVDDGTTPTWTRTATVTVHNLSAAARTYALAFDGTGLPAGINATIVPDSIPVPAGGSADVSVQLTVDNAQVPANDTPPYLYAGRLVASAPGESQAILVSFSRRAQIANDLCENAIDVGSGTYGAQQLAFDATTSASDPPSKCGCPGSNTNSLWYRITPSESGTVQIDSSGSSYLTVLGVYTGHCGGLRDLTCDDANGDYVARVTFEAKAGVSYYVEVSSFCGFAPGRTVLDISVPGQSPQLVAPFTEVFRANAGDLGGTGLTFTPDGTSYSACLNFANTYPTDPAGGTILPLSYDQVVAMHLADGATVALHGQHYDTVYVASNGHVSFTAGDPDYGPTFISHFGVPSIAVFSAGMLIGPLVPTAHVIWQQLADRVAVTWDNIQSSEPPPLPVWPYNSIQLELFFDGRIHMTFLETGFRGLTGLSDGTGAPSLFPTSNFIATPHCRMPTGGEVPIAGKQLTLRTKGTPQVTKFQTMLGTIAPALIPPQGGATDPTIQGGSIELYNPRTGEFLALPLPAVAWTAVQSTKGLTYRYRDNAGVHGPCSSVEVSARGVRAKCDRGSLAFTLDEVQMKLATSVTLGSTSAGTRFCGLFGGKITRDYGYAFSAKKAPLANRCWLPESYYP